MQNFILAASPDARLLKQIQAHLQEGGRYSVVCVECGKDALAALESEKYDIAILDGEINDLPFVTLTREMVALAPDLKLLVFPPQNNPRHPVLTGILVNGYVNKPFFGPEVSEKISRLVKEQNGIPQVAPEETDVTSTWIRYPEVGAQQIEQLLASTSASAGLLLLHGQVLASSGILTKESSSNIINYLDRYWNNIQSGELFRYLTMEHEASSYIIYAAPLIKETAIGLVYHAQKPLPEIRGEVSRLRKAFLDRYSNTRELREDFPPKQGEKTAPIVDEPPPPPEKPMNTHVFKDILPVEDDEDEPAGEGLSEIELQNLSNILAEMPVPDPDQEPSRGVGFTPIEPAPWEPVGDNLLADLEPQPPAGNPVSNAAEEPTDYGFEVPSDQQETVPIPAVSDTLPKQSEEAFPDFDFKLPWEEKLPSDGPVQDQPINSTPPPLPVFQENISSGGSSILESEGLSEYGQGAMQPFTFLIFPANSTQFITRDLAVQCNRQLPLILKSYGWQLNAISVRPLYLQWSALVPPLCSVPEKLSDIRLQLNTLFFNTYPDLLQTNPDGDFWMSGYLGLSGSNPPSNRMINDFLALYRQTEQQGKPL
jgi:DNA-binding NarL/FixJ family response regulator